jgi:hypothetical protein
LDVEREIDYYAKQSTAMTTLITVLGGLVAAIMAIGAVFGALNTMYSAVAERGREIATMRALGFSSWNVILSFLFEALLISFIAGLSAAWRSSAERHDHADHEFLDLLEHGLRLQDHPSTCCLWGDFRAGHGRSRRNASRARTHVVFSMTGSLRWRAAPGRLKALLVNQPNTGRQMFLGIFCPEP